MENNFTISCILRASPDKVYAAYMNSKQHSQMTGDRAMVDPIVGGSLNAGDGYIHAVFITLDPGKRLCTHGEQPNFLLIARIPSLKFFLNPSNRAPN